MMAPLPTPEAPFVMVSQGAWLTAVHGAVGELAVRPTVPVTAVAGMLAVLALKEKTAVPAEAPAWLTGKLIPAMVSDPVRAAPVFGVGPKTTRPVPLPDAPSITYRKELLLTAVQEQPGPVVTSTLYVSAAATMLALVGLSE